MADFLHDLAAKNLGTVDVIQPRRAALFEPSTSVQSLDFATPEGSAVETTFDEGRDIWATPTRRRVQAAIETGPLSSSEVRTPSVTAPSPAPPEPNDRDPRIFKPSRTEVANAEEPPDRAPVPPRSLPVPSITPIDRRNADLDPDRISPVLRRGEIEAPSEAIRAERGYRSTVGSDAQVVVTPSVAVREDRVKIDVNTASFPEQLGASPADGRVEKADVPTINVTIGRVEVRAVTSPAPAKPVRLEPPTLSLDEFLRRQRNGGAR